MLTNLENQLREQNAADKIDAVLEEIPQVRRDLGMLPLVTPTSQIVGTQAVINVLSGSRYATITKETAGVLKGEYGATPAEVNKGLQARVLEGAEPVTCRPADLLEPEVDAQTENPTSSTTCSRTHCFRRSASASCRIAVTLKLSSRHPAPRQRR
jgi:oxaloacetate decarboxylase alpha subunit